MKNVSVIILHYSDIENTKDSIESVLASDEKDIKIQLIVINNSKDDISNLKKGHKDVDFIESSKNVGFSGGNNLGIRKAMHSGADFVVLVNNDAIVDKKCIEELVLFAQKHNASLVSPKIYFYKGNEYHKSRYKDKDLGNVLWYAGGKMDWDNVVGFHIGVDEVDRGQFEGEEEIDYVSGCCMLLSKELIENVGIFNEGYFLYYEDNDLSQRAKKKGFKIMYDPKAIVWHKNAASSGGSGSELQDYYITRNRMLFGLHYAPLRSKLALVKEGLILFFLGRKWQKKGVLDFYLGRFGKGSFPLE